MKYNIGDKVKITQFKPVAYDSRYSESSDYIKYIGQIGLIEDIDAKEEQYFILHPSNFSMGWWRKNELELVTEEQSNQTKIKGYLENKNNRNVGVLGDFAYTYNEVDYYVGDIVKVTFDDFIDETIVCLYDEYLPMGWGSFKQCESDGNKIEKIKNWYELKNGELYFNDYIKVIIEQQPSIHMDLSPKNTTVEILEKLISIAEKNPDWRFIGLLSDKTNLLDEISCHTNEELLENINKYIRSVSFQKDNKVKIINGRFKDLYGVITDIDICDNEHPIIVKIIGGREFSSFEAYLHYDDIEKI